jgi:hypothetical protein
MTDSGSRVERGDKGPPRLFFLTLSEQLLALINH